MLGPSLHQQGGMASVEKLIADQISEAVEVQHLSIHEEASLFRRLQVFASAIVQFFSKLMLNQVDLVHLHVSERGSVLRTSILMVLARWFHKPVLIHTHGSEFHLFYDRLPRLIKQGIAAIFQRSAYVITLSESWKTYYTSVCNLELNQAIVLYNPVVVPASVPARTDRQKVRLVFLGRIGERKGAFDTIHAIAQLSKLQQQQIELHLAGDGEIDQARKLIDSLGLQDCVKLLGWINAETRDRLLHNADIFVLPSYNEGLPIALLEAMAWGLPTIVTAVGGIPEVADHSTGFLVSPGSIEQITAAMQALIENESLRVGMGSKSRERVIPLNLNNYCETLHLIYAQAVVGRDKNSETIAFATPANSYE